MKIVIEYEIENDDRAAVERLLADDYVVDTQLTGETLVEVSPGKFMKADCVHVFTKKRLP